MNPACAIVDMAPAAANTIWTDSAVDVAQPGSIAGGPKKKQQTHAVACAFCCRTFFESREV